MLSLLKIEGNSMLPTMANGNFVVVSHFFFGCKPGDIVVINHPIYKKIVKRIKKISEDGELWLQGENIESVSSEKMRWIDKEWVKGKVILTIAKKK